MVDHWYWWRDFVTFEVLMDNHNTGNYLLPVYGMDQYDYDL